MLYTRLQPVLYVHDLAAEKAFYEKLGFTVKDETATLASVTSGDTILFGLLYNRAFPTGYFLQHFVWEIGVTSVQAVYEICEREKLRIEEMPALEDWGKWAMAVSSPNGWYVTFEGGE